MSNDIYYQSRTAGVYGGTITLIIVAAIAVALRLTARSISAANLWWDDWTLVIALVSQPCPLFQFTCVQLPDRLQVFKSRPKCGLLGPG